MTNKKLCKNSQNYAELENKALEEFREKFNSAIDPDARGKDSVIEQFWKSHLQLAYKSGEEKGLNLRKAYNDPELLKQFSQQALTAERERFIEKLNYLKQCANGKKFPYWETSERPDLIIRKIDDFLQELQNK